MLDAIGGGDVQQLSLELRRRHRHHVAESRCIQHLAVHESRIGHRKEQAAQPTGGEHFDVDALGQHRDRATTDQSLLGSLSHHRFTYRQQHDHHPHANAESTAQQQRPQRT